MTTTGEAEDVRLTLPALPQYGRLAGQCAAGLGLRRRLGFRSIEDLRLAVDETIIALLDGAPTGARLHLVFHVTDAAVGLDATIRDADGTARLLTEDAATRFDLFVSELVDAPAIDRAGGTISFVSRRGAT